MEFWLVENGEKTGPFPIYQVRERIQSGELSPETQGWHRDQNEWKALNEIEVFRREFDEEPEAEQTVEKREIAPPTVPQNSTTWAGAVLRFLARWVDFLIYQLILLTSFQLSGVNFLTAGGLVQFLVVFPLVLMILEGLFLERWGATPGKWLGGIKVEQEGQGNLKWYVGAIRSFRVYVMGLGMMLPYLSLACQLFSLWFLLKKKLTLWDMRTRIQVRIKEFKPERYILLVFTAVILMVGNSMLALSAMMEASDQLPEPQKSQVEQIKKMFDQIKSTPDPDV